MQELEGIEGVDARRGAGIVDTGVHEAQGVIRVVPVRA